MRDPFYRSFAREMAGALFLGAIVTFAIVVGIRFFAPQDTVLMAENTTSASEPVTEDTPGPVIEDRAVLDNAGTPKPTLSDKER